MSIEVTGLKETLRDLNKLDPALRREIGKDIRNVVKPVADTINSRLPGGAPLSGKKTTALKTNCQLAPATPTNKPHRKY